MGEGRFFGPMRLFSDVSERIDDPWLRRAFILAERGRGTTSPNPLVGCVIVADGEIVGEGYHERPGGPHAEVVALTDAGAAARGATAYVTLEPCAHHGRTPPCVDALVAAGVSRVVIGMPDPNGAVVGGGADVLRAAGVAVELADDPVPFEIQNEAWVASLRTGRPFVRVKLALSLDGHLSLEPGRPASITGASGAEVTQRLRQGADAVLVGGATVAADDPALTVRDSEGLADERQPLRVVFFRDSLPGSNARVFRDSGGGTLLLGPHRCEADARALYPDWVGYAAYDEAEGVASAMRTLLGLGIVDLLVEAGPRLFTLLWDEGLVDELITVQAGGLAGASAPPAYLGSAANAPDVHASLSHDMTPLESGLVGDVAVTVWRPSERVGSECSRD